MNLFKGVQEVLFLLICLAILQDSVSPPVTQKKKGHEDNKIEEEEAEDPNNELLIEYNRYLKEVVSALESDPEFKAKLEKAEESDIRSGRIASELEHVDHRVRSMLDEIKRTELERLRHLATKEFELKNGIDTDHLKIPEHLDHTNPHTFEIEDLRKLILKTTADLAEADRKRRDEFKEYEMQKEFEKQEKLKELDEEHKKELLHEIEEKEKKHKEHQPLHHPGSKQQLEEVWEKQDHMESQEFNPKTFFHLHDLDGNGYWDADEVKALFLKELDKMYTAGAPEDDMRERVEEMERMREHVFKEADTNKDGLISFEEFVAQTQKPEFEKDSGWEGIDESQVYTQEEYKEFERRRQEEIQRLIAQGVLPPHPGMPPPHPGYQQHPGQPQYHQEFPAQHHPGMQQGQMQHPGQQYGHPNQVPQGHQMQQGYVGPGQVHPGQMQGQMHPGQVQGQYHPGQVHPGQVPQGQGQVPQGQVPQAQVPQGQVPQAQAPQGQVPQANAPQGQVPQAQVPQDQVPPKVQQPGHVSPNQVQQQQQQQQAPPVQSAQQGLNINMQLPRHPPQPIEQRHEPINLSQNTGNAAPQVVQVR